MKKKRPLDVLELLQSVHHLSDVVSVDRTEVAESHGLEKVTAAIADKI